jgi:hypothetical protein
MAPQPARLAQEPRKRPWYLVAALLGAVAFGVNGGCDGFRQVSLYRAEHLSTPASDLAWVADDGDRDRLVGLFQQQLDVLDVAKDRVFPLAVAALVVGFALTLFAMRAMAGRGSARAPLCQLVAVQAILGVAAFILLRDVRAADVAWRAAVTEVEQKQLVGDGALGQVVANVMRYVQPLVLVLKSAASIFIVVALTRPKTREFFDARPDPVSEQ